MRIGHGWMEWMNGAGWMDGLMHGRIDNVIWMEWCTDGWESMDGVDLIICIAISALYKQ